LQEIAKDEVKMLSRQQALDGRTKVRQAAFREKVRQGAKLVREEVRVKLRRVFLCFLPGNQSIGLEYTSHFANGGGISGWIGKRNGMNRCSLC
jgi:hypothetical protein